MQLEQAAVAKGEKVQNDDSVCSRKNSSSSSAAGMPPKQQQQQAVPSAAAPATPLQSRAAGKKPIATPPAAPSVAPTPKRDGIAELQRAGDELRELRELRRQAQQERASSSAMATELLRLRELREKVARDPSAALNLSTRRLESHVVCGTAMNLDEPYNPSSSAASAPGISWPWQSSSSSSQPQPPAVFAVEYRDGELDTERPTRKARE